MTMLKRAASRPSIDAPVADLELIGLWRTDGEAGNAFEFDGGHILGANDQQ